MASAVVLSKSAILDRLALNLTEQVLSSAPLVRFNLPYVNHVRTFISERRQINKVTEMHVIDNILEVVGDPNDADAKTVDALITEVDDLFDAAFTLAGYTVNQQRVSQLESYRTTDENGAELEVAQITFQMDVL